MAKVGIFFADGCEEIEGLAVVDICRRAGLEIETISIMGRDIVAGSHRIKFQTDAVFEDVDFDTLDGVILPGGMPGTLHLKEHKGLADLLCEFNENGRKIAAICAAPTVFGALGLLKEKAACCYPGMEEQLNCKEAKFCSFVTDGNITTSRGVGTAIPFALELIRQLFGNEKASEIAESIVYEE